MERTIKNASGGMGMQLTRRKTRDRAGVLLMLPPERIRPNPA